MISRGLEDNDSAIFYDGPWTQVTSEGSGFDLSGNSAHFLPANIVNSTTAPATLTLSFTGRNIGVYGVASIFNNSVPAPADMPKWECIIDGNLLDTVSNPYGVYPLQSYCDFLELADYGSHVFQLRVNQSGSGFWIDFLGYELDTLLTTPPPNYTAWIPAMDLTFSTQGWAPMGSGSVVTQGGPTNWVEAPALSVSVFGSSITWYGISKAGLGIASSLRHALLVNGTTSDSKGFYTIDNSSERNDFWASVPQDVVHANSNPYVVALFTTPSMKIGPHTLNVYYNFNSTVWPLTLDSLIVANGFAPIPPPPVDSGRLVFQMLLGVFIGIFVSALLVAITRWVLRLRRGQQQDMIPGKSNSIKLQFSRSTTMS